MNFNTYCSRPRPRCSDSLVATVAASLAEFAVKLVIHCDPDGLYLIKGGGKKVWKLFPRIRKDWRKPQGLIFGKRCGVTQNIGPAARGS